METTQKERKTLVIEMKNKEQRPKCEVMAMKTKCEEAKRFMETTIGLKNET
jgi:hypothetical protein